MEQNKTLCHKDTTGTQRNSTTQLGQRICTWMRINNDNDYDNSNGHDVDDNEHHAKDIDCSGRQRLARIFLMSCQWQRPPNKRGKIKPFVLIVIMIIPNASRGGTESSAEMALAIIVPLIYPLSRQLPQLSLSVAHVSCAPKLSPFFCLVAPARVLLGTAWAWAWARMYVASTYGPSMAEARECGP